MTIETPIEITHVPPRLRVDFTGKLQEATAGTPEERESNFLSRALAAYAIHKLAGCAQDDAAAAVIDGGGDGGIDALYYSPATSILWVVQSKFFADGRGEPALGDVAKFKLGLENLLQGHFESFGANAAWQAIIPQLAVIFANGALQVRAVLVYSGIHIISEDRRRLFDELQRIFSSEQEYLQIRVANLTTIHDWISGADRGPGIEEVSLAIRKPGWVREPYETVYGFIPLVEIAQLYAQHGNGLIAANIRGYKGATDVNEQIVATIREEPVHFFYLNNGLTAYCKRLEVSNFDRANPDVKRIRAFGFSIVNGAQTLGAVTEYFSEAANVDGCVFVKVISLERCDDDRAFADRITRSTNFQNQIGLRDFVALDDQQERIASHLKLSGITYHYKDTADTPVPDSDNFTLEEATTALACAIQQRECDFISRILANRRSLWSMEEVYPAEEIHRSRYSRVFSPECSARTTWRAVQTQRIVIEVMQNNGRASAGARKAFFENARWLVLNIVFLQLHPERANDLSLTPDEKSAIAALTDTVAEALWSACTTQGFVTRRADAAAGVDIYETVRHFRSVFSTAADCQRLRGATLARFARPNPVPLAAIPPQTP